MRGSLFMRSLHRREQVAFVPVRYVFRLLGFCGFLFAGADVQQRRSAHQRDTAEGEDQRADAAGDREGDVRRVEDGDFLGIARLFIGIFLIDDDLKSFRHYFIAIGSLGLDQPVDAGVQALEGESAVYRRAGIHGGIF